MLRTPYTKSVLFSLAAVALGASLISGCGRTQPQEKSFGTQALDPQRNATIQSDRDHDIIDRGAPLTEGRDYLMGRNQNPNLLMGHAAVRNTQIDRNNMEMMAKSVPGVEGARITLNGGEAYVTLDLIPNVTASQARSIEQQVIAALRQKVPRYDFHVTSNDAYHRP
ncbi:sporulation protein [Brevibacillus sp. H7]|uniref:sporulation protein n=1 Tax=Brevibacillus sp. H7 TaxID=3349138 RepID=UPI0037F2375F